MATSDETRLLGTKRKLSPEFLNKGYTDEPKKKKLLCIPEFIDANEAGGEFSDKCTLILTRGDSAKALAMRGIGVVGQDYYGVFPLSRKLLNVRKASHKQIMENAEIQHIILILGLQQGKVYDNVKSLRYGKLMIMTDQNHDGSHFKGLFINFIHLFWPSLLKLPGFLAEFITPIVEATHTNGEVLPFYNMPAYKSWKESLGGGKANYSWSIKYNKGLGSSIGKKGNEYFERLEEHMRYFTWVDEEDGDAIDMAFSKKTIEELNNWIQQFMSGTSCLVHEKELIRYCDFVNKEVILPFLADMKRSIPSMVDGLKPVQRKILCCAFKHDLVTEKRVSRFMGYVLEHFAYRDDFRSLDEAMVGMAQDFVGSNNINLFNQGGQFGTRLQGGKDHAAAECLYTNLTPIARLLFPENDDILLDYLIEDEEPIEPTWYAPVIPLVLVNGSESIGKEWSNFVPKYNPRDLCANVRRLLRGEPMVPIHPWYKGFKGTIEETTMKDNALSYTLSGIIDQIDETTLRITELPIRRWIQDYKEFLENVVTGKLKERFIKDYWNCSYGDVIHFEVSMSKRSMSRAMREGNDELLKKFKLTTTISTSNMYLIDSTGVIKKYDNPEQILKEFFDLRLQKYIERKEMRLANLKLELFKLEYTQKFIKDVVQGKVIVKNKTRAQIFSDLKTKGFFTFFENKSIGDENSSATAENEKQVAGFYEDLLSSVSIGALTLEEQLASLLSEEEKLTHQLKELEKSTPEEMWMMDIDALDRKLQEAGYEAGNDFR